MNKNKSYFIWECFFLSVQDFIQHPAHADPSSIHNRTAPTYPHLTMLAMTKKKTTTTRVWAVVGSVLSLFDSPSLLPQLRQV